MRYSGYFEWLVKKISPSIGENAEDFSRLLEYLYNTPFSSHHPMDDNRIADAEAMRSRYFLRPEIVTGMRKTQPVSVLEVLIALAKRMNQIVEDDYDKAPHFFWLMMENLGLIEQNNVLFDPAYVNYRLDILRERKFEPDGSGGALFIIQNPNHDMRDADLWYQAQWYLADNV